MAENWHVIPDDHGGWAVKKLDESPSSVHRTREEAVGRARDALRNAGGGDLIIHARDGRIRDKDTVFPGPRSEVSRAREAVFARMKSHLATHLKIDPDRIDESAHFENTLEADSLDLMMLRGEIEEIYGVHISDEQAKELLTVGQAVDFVLAHGAAPILEAEARRIVEALGESETSRKGRALFDAYRQLREHVAELASVRPERSLTLGQFVAAARARASAHRRPRGSPQPGTQAQRISTAADALRPSNDAIVSLVDRDGNGLITREDFTRWMAAVGVDELEAHHAFDQIDLDGTGNLSTEEFLEALRSSQAGTSDIDLLGRSVLSVA